MVPNRKDSRRQVAKCGTSEEVMNRKIAKDSVQSRHHCIKFVYDYKAYIYTNYRLGDHFPTLVWLDLSAAADPPGQSVENQPMARHTSWI